MHSKVDTRPLLAKSRTGGREISLRTHLQDTANAARLIFSQDKRVGRNFARAFKLDQSESESFLLNLEIAALFHDIGKANEGFADAIDRKMNAQVVRHEHLSAMILQLESVRKWLSTNALIRHSVILAAVLSHHLKAGFGDIGEIPIGCMKESCKLYLVDQQVTDIFAKVSSIGNLGCAPSFEEAIYSRYSGEREPWNTCIEEIKTEGNAFRNKLRKQDSQQSRSDRRLLAAVKCALIIADSVASAVVRKGYALEDWIDENVHLHDLSLSGVELRSQIITRCENKIATRQNAEYAPASFQLAVAKLGTKPLLKAGCGVGKTLAAYYWAESQLNQGEFGRLIFLYPTRGTATEGFKDYTGWAPDGEALLLHSQSRYVLEAISQNPPESAVGKNYLDETDERLFALANFKRRYFSATVDQFLSFLQHGYQSICMSVVLADSVVVLDEIHSYDTRLFNTVLEYLKSMHIPTLCMTATLTNSRTASLVELGIEEFPNKDQRLQFSDLRQTEDHNRYKVMWIDDSAEALRVCKKAIESGEKVLWVVNTVDRCQRIAQELSESFPQQVICYHSRFRLMDREKGHERCIENFHPAKRVDSGIVAVTTQVCEMSLDLDANRLITEIAPISSLVQRMGRANRHLRDRNFLAPVHIYKPDSNKPYEKAEIEASSNFLNWLIAENAAAVNQAALADGIEKFSPAELDLDPSARLFDSGYFAKPANLRDFDEFTVPAILNSDLPLAENLVSRKESIEKLVVPVPKRHLDSETQKPSWLPSYMNLAHDELYSSIFGFGIKPAEVN